MDKPIHITLSAIARDLDIPLTNIASLIEPWEHHPETPHHQPDEDNDATHPQQPPPPPNMYAPQVLGDHGRFPPAPRSKEQPGGGRFHTPHNTKEPMPYDLNHLPYERLDLDTYYDDFDRNFRKTQFWKLERTQTSAEPSNPSWVAFNHGNWTESLQLLQQWQQELGPIHAKNLINHVNARRIRIIEEPLTPYTQWELELLQRRRQITGGIRTITAAHPAIQTVETKYQLPDLNIMDHVMYRVVYDEHGVLDHAYKYTDPDIIKVWRQITMILYGHGTDITDYYREHVAHLPPPTTGTPLPDDYLEQHGKPRQRRT